MDFSGFTSEQWFTFMGCGNCTINISNLYLWVGSGIQHIFENLIFNKDVTFLFFN